MGRHCWTQVKNKQSRDITLIIPLFFYRIHFQKVSLKSNCECRNVSDWSFSLMWWHSAAPRTSTLDPRLPPGLQLLFWLHFKLSKQQKKTWIRLQKNETQCQEELFESLDAELLHAVSSLVWKSNINLLCFHNLPVSVWVIIHEGWQMVDGWSRKLQHAATQRRQNHTGSNNK